MLKSKNLKIAFVTTLNAKDRTLHSGTPYFFAKLLEKYCGEVELIHNLRPSKLTPAYIFKNLLNEFVIMFIIERSKQFFWNIIGKRYYWERSISVAKYYSKIVKSKIVNSDFDLIFAEKSSLAFAFLDTKIPIVYDSDSTFAAMIDYYANCSNLASAAIKEGNIIQEKALQKCSLFICPSEWAANSAEKYYFTDKDKIKIIPRPCNLEYVPSRDKLVTKQDTSTCKLLFVGVDWQRKGGDLAIEAVNELNRRGVHSMLTICGCYPPKTYLNNPYIEAVGFLNKEIAEERMKLEALFLNASFFFVPTRAECYGQVFAEAGAFGLPVIATDTGGIPSVIFDKENGKLLSLDATGRDFAFAIEELWRDRERYNLMRAKSRQFFEQKFSPEAWGRMLNQEVKQLVQINA